MMDDNLDWLMRWYLSRCNDDWEHRFGVEIGTLDNPGWTLKVDLRETALSGREFVKVTHGNPADDLGEWTRNGSWWVADVQNDKFEAACGPLELLAVISVFRSWAQTIPPS